MPWGNNPVITAPVESNFKGFYNATTNTPPIVDGVGEKGDYYIVDVAGNNNPTGEFLNIDQQLVYNGASWVEGGDAQTTDDEIVDNDYVVLQNTTVEIGDTVTTALGSLQGQIQELAGIVNAVEVSGNQSIDYLSLNTNAPILYVNVSNTIVKLTLVNGGAFVAYPVLLGSPTTFGLNPMEAVTVAKQANGQVICS